MLTTTMRVDGDWQAVEGVLSQDMAIVDEYMESWKLNTALQKRCRQFSISTTRKLNVS